MAYNKESKLTCRCPEVSLKEISGMEEKAICQGLKGSEVLSDPSRCICIVGHAAGSGMAATRSIVLAEASEGYFETIAILKVTSPVGQKRLEGFKAATGCFV